MDNRPLAERLRPESLADIVGQEHLVGAGKIISEIIENKQPGEELSRGQRLTLERLQERPGMTLWVVHGIPPHQIISMGPLNGEQRPCDVHELRELAQEWWDGLGK